MMKRVGEGVGVGLLSVATLAIIAGGFWAAFAIGASIAALLGLHPAVGALIGMFILCGTIGGIVGACSDDETSTLPRHGRDTTTDGGA